MRTASCRKYCTQGLLTLVVPLGSILSGIDAGRQHLVANIGDGAEVASARCPTEGDSLLY